MCAASSSTDIGPAVNVRGIGRLVVSLVDLARLGYTW